MALSDVAHYIQYNPGLENHTDFTVGKSLYSDNLWDFNGLLTDNKYLNGARLMIKFDEWSSKPKLLDTVKQYMISVLLTNKFNTAKRMYDGINSFLRYLSTSLYQIHSFSDIDQMITKEYFQHLLTTKKENGEPLSATTIKKSAQAFKELLERGQAKGWDVPEQLNYLPAMYSEMIIHNRKIVKEKQLKSQDILDKETLDRIINIALEDLTNNINVFVAASVLITTQVGLRINEFLTLKHDCLSFDNGVTTIKHFTRKLHNEEIEVSKPANELVVKAITTLQHFTKEYREFSDLPYLFIAPSRNKKGYPIELIAHPTWNKNYLKPWLIYHDIRDNSGTILDITSHTFRHCFATYAISSGASIETVSRMMGHRSIRGTQHYAKTIQEDLKRRFAEVFNEGAILSGKNALKIKEKLQQNNPFKGKTVEQVDNLRKSMKIQVLSHGLCTHHPMRNEPCMGDGVCLGCQNFITTPDFLSIHKNRLENVRNELSSVSSDGPYESKLKHIENYLVGIVDDLEKQMKENN